MNALEWRKFEDFEKCQNIWQSIVSIIHPKN